MRNVFTVSLCHKGILGGALYFKDNEITYRTNKLSVDSQYRNLDMSLADIIDVKTGRLLLLPTVSLCFKDGKCYKFIVYCRKSFINRLKEAGIAERY